MRQEAKEEKQRAKGSPRAGEFSHARSASQNIQSLNDVAAPGGATQGPADQGSTTDAANHLRHPPTAEVPLRGKSMDLRREGRSMDMPREHAMQPKQSMDAAVRGSMNPSSFSPPSARGNAVAVAGVEGGGNNVPGTQAGMSNAENSQ